MRITEVAVQYNFKLYMKLVAKKMKTEHAKQSLNKYRWNSDKAM